MAPEKKHLLTIIGSIYGSNRQYNKSIDYYKKAAELDYQFDFMNYFNYGSAYYFLSQMDSAKKYLELSMKLDSINSPAGENLAWVYLDEAPEKSCYYFNRSYLKDSLNARTINNLGYSHLLCGNLDTAFQLFNKAQKIDPYNSFVYRNYGLYYRMIDEKEMACQNLEKSLDLKIVEMYGQGYVKELVEYCEQDK